MQYRPSLPQVNDNVSHDRPIREFALLFSGVLVFLFMAFWVLGMTVDLAVGYISPEMEARIFSPISPSNRELVAGGDQRQAELQRMVNELQECSQITFPLKVYLIDSDDANALAFPGGRIVVLEGLLAKVVSKNGLSFVLAHELAHFKNRDHLRGMGRGIVFTAVAALTTGAGSNITQLFAPTANFSQMHYSRARESMADQQALQTLGCYYGHTGGATEFFEAMKENKRQKSDAIGQYFASHQDAVTRINNLHRLAKNLNLVEKDVLPLPKALDAHIE